MPQPIRVRGGAVRFLLGSAAAAALLVLLGGPIDAGKKGGKQPKQPRAVATASSDKGTLLVRWPSDKPWRVAAPKEALYAGEPLLALPGSVAAVEAGKTKPVLKLELVGNLPGLYRTSAMESMATLGDPKDADLDLTLERGRFRLSHVGGKGATARAWIRFDKEPWGLDLSEPGTRVAIGLKLNRLPWTEFPKKPDAKLRPSKEATLIVLAGSVDLSVGGVRQTLGPLSVYHWRSETGPEEVSVLTELPADLKPPAEASAKKILAGVRELQGRLAKGSPAATLADALADKDAAVRSAAVYGLAALGETATALKALADAKRADVRQAALLALRHWVGQSYDDDQRVYDLLVLQKYSKPHAAIVVKLLHNFTPRQLAQAETYEALIHYLTHEQLAVRQLAVWHLNRLVPGGDAIAYDPAGTPAQLRQGQTLWRKRIPEGKIPTAPP